MKKLVFFLLAILLGATFSFAQSNVFEKIDFILGEWSGTGSGFGNEKSKIESSFQLVMEGKYIEVTNESKFDPTADNV